MKTATIRIPNTREEEIAIPACFMEGDLKDSFILYYLYFDGDVLKCDILHRYPNGSYQHITDGSKNYIYPERCDLNNYTSAMAEYFDYLISRYEKQPQDIIPWSVGDPCMIEVDGEEQAGSITLKYDTFHVEDENGVIHKQLRYADLKRFDKSHFQNK